MSKYKTGDYLIAEVIGGGDDGVYLKGLGYVYDKDLGHTEKYDPNEAEKAAQEAWDLARKIVLLIADGGYTIETLKDIFGTIAPYDIMKAYASYADAKAKVDAYEQRNQIKVGDVVKRDNGDEILVTRVWSGDMVDGIMKSGRTTSSILKEVVKTGKLCDSLSEWLSGREEEKRDE